MSKFSQNILKKIQREKQIPWWHFALRNVLFWTLFLFSLFLGALAFAFVLLAFFQLDIEPLMTPGISHWQYLLTVLPLLWLLFLVLFSFLSYLGLHQTKHGYRFSLPMIIGGNILGSIILGVGFYFLGTPHWIEEKTPLQSYRQAQEKRLWSQPKQGFLSGIVQKINFCTIKEQKTCSLLLVDFQKKEWKVNTENLPPFIQKKMRERNIQKKRIKIVGKVIGENEFLAEQLMPFHRPPLQRRNDQMEFEENPPLRERRSKNHLSISENTFPLKVPRPSS